MCKEKHTKLGHTQFIPGGNNEPTKYKKGKDKVIKGGPEFVKDEYEQGIAQMNKDASSTSLIYTHGKSKTKRR